MLKEHIENLRALRDFLVEDRRSLVTSVLADPASVGESAGDFLNLQQFIDVVERAISHEQSLDRPGATSWPPKPKLPPRPS
jgi:flagellar biosynthesis chaperone FliJ